MYCSFACFESLGILSRGGGYSANLLPIGISLQNQILSLNRFIGFFIPPAIGLYVDFGANGEQVINLGLVGSLISFCLLFLMYIRFEKIIEIFNKSCNLLNKNGYSLTKLIFSKKLNEQEDISSSSKKINNNKILYKFVIAQLVNTGLAMPSVFVVNLLAINNPEYSSSILQATTLLSGFGNLILNFYIIPRLAINECNKNNNALNIYRSIYLGKVIGLGILGPFVLLVFRGLI